MSRLLGILSILTSTAALSAAYLLEGYLAAGLVIILLGAAWSLAAFFKRIRAASPGMLISALAAGAGVLLGMQFWLVLTGALAGLIAWDLANFSERLQLAAPVDDARGLEKRHLVWLGGTASLGLLLAAISSLVQMQIPFGWTLLLAVIGVLGLVRFVAWAARG